MEIVTYLIPGTLLFWTGILVFLGRKAPPSDLASPFTKEYKPNRRTSRIRFH